MTDLEKNEGRGLDTLAGEINKEHRAFVSSLKKTAEHGIRAGALLAEAKAQCAHGTWINWLSENFEGAPRTAQEYMRLHNHRNEIRAKTRDSAHMSISGALKEIATPRPEVVASERLGQASSDSAVPMEVADGYYPAKQQTEPRRGAIEQLSESPEGTQALASINTQYATAKARDRVRGKLQDLRWLMCDIPPEEVAREVAAWYVGEEVENSVMGETSKGFNRTLGLYVEPAQDVRDWLGRYLDCLERFQEEMENRLSARSKGQDAED